MNISEVNKSFKEFAFAKNPDLLKEYNVSVYRKGEKPPGEKGQVDINNPLIQLVLQEFFTMLKQPMHPEKVQLLINYALQLAERFHDDYSIQKLNYLYSTCGQIGFPLPLIEPIAFRDTFLMRGNTINKGYNYGYKQKPIKLGEMIQALNEMKLVISRIVTDLIDKHDIPISFSLSEQPDKTFMVD